MSQKDKTLWYRVTIRNMTYCLFFFSKVSNLGCKVEDNVEGEAEILATCSDSSG